MIWAAAPGFNRLWHRFRAGSRNGCRRVSQNGHMYRTAGSCRFGEITVNRDIFRVDRGGEVLSLEPKSIRLLLYLIDNRARVVGKDELIRRIWEDAAVTDNALTRVVAQLRKALGDDAKVARYIE